MMKVRFKPYYSKTPRIRGYILRTCYGKIAYLDPFI